MPDAFPTFSRRRYPTARPADKAADRRRGSSSSRGYDRKWQKARLRHIRANPFCRFCEQVGRLTVTAEHVDHIMPLNEGGARLDPKNLQSLCAACHDGLKQRMERYAKRARALDQLALWCADPEARPRALGDLVKCADGVYRPRGIVHAETREIRRQ